MKLYFCMFFSLLIAVDSLAMDFFSALPGVINLVNSYWASGDENNVDEELGDQSVVVLAVTTNQDQAVPEDKNSGQTIESCDFSQAQFSSKKAKALDDAFQKELLENLACDKPGSDPAVCLIEGMGELGPAILSVTGGATSTQFGMAFSCKGLEAILKDPRLRDTSSPFFHEIKNMMAFFPVRVKMPKFVKHCMGLLAEFELYADHDGYAAQLKSGEKVVHKKLTEAGKGMLRQYTSSENWWCTRLNLNLNIDKVDNPVAIQSVRILKSIIGWQTPKYQGLVFRGSLHSPLEIFIMLFKRQFYIPAFVSTSTSYNKMILSEHYDFAPKNTAFQNVIFVIDTSEFPLFSTLIQKDESKYDEDECLISCYNVYEWMGARVIRDDKRKTRQEHKGIFLEITLKVLRHDKSRDPISHRIHGNKDVLPETWAGKHCAEIHRCRHINPINLIRTVSAMVDSYNRMVDSDANVGKKLKKLDWINAELDYDNPSTDLPQSKGQSLDGKEVEKFIDRKAP